ncbi:MAG: Lrp/AsnC family transcriptional regulator [Candidatus Woesearchaeota archaeon]
MYRENDLKIVSFLREDSRTSLTKMSKKTGIPVSTIFEKLNKRAGDIVQKNTCIIDFTKLGMHARANIAIKTFPGERDKLKEFLVRNRHVNSLQKINNGYDYMADVIFSNLKDLEEFCELLDERFKIRTKQIYYVIEDIEREKFMSSPESLALLEIPR